MGGENQELLVEVSKLKEVRLVDSGWILWMGNSMDGVWMLNR